ncbi:MAG: glycosyltransferase family 2 protein [Calditrichaeota bacterium]|nr:glycosyltransferase family 2 protein [Calditrichota bacterium]
MTSSEKHARQSSAARPQVSVVVPLFNEVDNVRPLVAALVDTLRNERLTYEIILVDDGSTDGTAEALREVQAQHEHVVVIRLRTNFGQSPALAAGFARARGEVVVTMDGDLQNDPRDIPRLLATLDQGYDVVSGWRKRRQDGFFIRRIPSMLANRLVCRVTGVALHDTGCALKAYRGEIIRRLHLYGEMHRFIPALSKMEGARIAELVVRHHPRRYGKSKYNLSRTFRVILDLLTLNLLMRHVRNPLRFFGTIGVLFGLAAVGTLVAAIVLASLVTDDPGVLNVLITLLFLLLVSAFQFLFFGLVAKLIVETGTRREDYFFDLEPMSADGGRA